MFNFFTGRFFEDGAETDVVFCRKRVLGEVLEKGSDGVIIIFQIVVINVFAIDENFAFFGLVETTEKFDEGAFPGTIDTNDGDVVGGVDFETDAFEDPVFGGRIFEPDVPELDAGSKFFGKIVGRSRDFIRECHKILVIFDEEVVLVNVVAVSDEIGNVTDKTP